MKTDPKNVNALCRAHEIGKAEGIEKGRAEIIEELKRFTHTNILGKKFIFVEDYMFEKLSFAEELKEQI